MCNFTHSKSTWHRMSFKIVKILAALFMLAAGAHLVHASPIAWYQNLPEAARVADRQHKPLLVMVGARWCGFCQQIQQQTFRDPVITQRVAADFIPVLIDVDEQPVVTQQLNAVELPTLLVMSADSRVLQRVTGFQSAAQLNGRLAAFHPTQPIRHFQPTRPCFWRAHTPPDTQTTSHASVR